MGRVNRGRKPSRKVAGFRANTKVFRLSDFQVLPRAAARRFAVGDCEFTGELASSPDEFPLHDRGVRLPLDPPASDRPCGWRDVRLSAPNPGSLRRRGCRHAQPSFLDVAAAGLRRERSPVGQPLRPARIAESNDEFRQPQSISASIRSKGGSSPTATSSSRPVVPSTIVQPSARRATRKRIAAAPRPFARRDVTMSVPAMQDATASLSPLRPAAVGPDAGTRGRNDGARPDVERE
jgi:hypothetical protein